MKPITIGHMVPRHFKYEGWLYTLAFLLALSLRLIQLGALPLTDAEAEPALQALHITQGLKPALSPHPFYILLTTPLFFIYGGAANFLARFISAIVGSALVFAPLLFQGRLKPRPGLILAFFIALDPGLVTISRTAASGIFAVTFIILAWGFWINHRPRLAGTFAALALLGGPAIWPGLLGLAIAWAIRQGLEGRSAKEEAQPQEERPSLQSPISNLESSISNLKSPTSNPELRSALISFLAAFFIAGTLFLVIPNGLSAALGSIADYVSGWMLPSGVPSRRLFLSLLIYQPAAIILALAAIGRGWWRGSRRIIQLNIWLLVAVLLVVFYPARQVSDLAWALIPLWVLAALELTRYFDILPQERAETLGVVLLTLFILVFAWLDFTASLWVSAPSPEFSLRIWLLAGSIVLLAVSIMLVAFGWSVRVARLGGIWGLVLGLSILSLGGTLGAAGLRGASNPELWWPTARPMQAGLINATINDLSEWGSGDDNALPVVILNIDSPALEWAVRGHQVTNAKALDPAASPAFIITSFEIDPSLAASYRGQDFMWRQKTSWDILSINDWMRWVALREAPQENETIILWARADLFLDASPLQTAP